MQKIVGVKAIAFLCNIVVTMYQSKDVPTLYHESEEKSRLAIAFRVCTGLSLHRSLVSAVAV